MGQRQFRDNLRHQTFQHLQRIAPFEKESDPPTAEFPGQCVELAYRFFKMLILNAHHPERILAVGVKPGVHQQIIRTDLAFKPA